jgi:hypothetical protein
MLFERHLSLHPNSKTTNTKKFNILYTARRRKKGARANRQTKEEFAKTEFANSGPRCSRTTTDHRSIPLFAGPGNPTSGWIYQGIYNLYKIYINEDTLTPLFEMTVRLAGLFGTSCDQECLFWSHFVKYLWSCIGMP